MESYVFQSAIETEAMITRRILTYLFINACICAAQLEPTVLLRGVIRHRGTPVQAELEFRDERGKTIRAKSAADGSYQTVLAPGTSYRVAIINENLERFSYSIDMPPSNKYMERTHDFVLDEQAPQPTPTLNTTPRTKPASKSKRTTRKQR